LYANLIGLNKIKIGAVSYLNTKPLLYGIKHSAIINNIELIEDHPANIAELLLANKIDIGLVPTAIIPQISNATIVADYCIGANATVASVCLFSETTIDNIEAVILDYQSRTSVALCKILLKEYWKREVKFIEGREGYRNEIKGTTAAIVIGDRAFEQAKQSAYKYDLAEAWINFTKLPFVFAAWVANTNIEQEFMNAFNKANAYGIENIDKVVEDINYPFYNLQYYYTNNISYFLDEEKKKGLELFLQFLKQ